MDIYCKVMSQGLVPLYDSDLENKKRLKEGVVVKCKITNPRNLRHHKKYFALVKLVLNNLPERLTEQLNIRNEKDMHRRFKRDLGYFKSYVNEYGEREIEYDSISFSAMDQFEFEKFYYQAVDLAAYKYLPGTDRQDVIEEVERFM